VKHKRQRAIHKTARLKNWPRELAQSHEVGQLRRELEAMTSAQGHPT
jgi:hypothetical protein